MSTTAKKAAAKKAVAKKAVSASSQTASRVTPSKKAVAKKATAKSAPAAQRKSRPVAFKSPAAMPAKKAAKKAARKAGFAAAAIPVPLATLATLAAPAASGFSPPGPFAATTLPWWVKSVVTLAARVAEATETAKALAAKPASKKVRKPVVKATSADQGTYDNLVNLLDLAREMCYATEAQQAEDIVIVEAAQGLGADSAELQTLSSLHNMEQFMTMMAQDEPGPPPEVEVLRTMGTTMSMRVNETAMRVVRRNSPGLRVYASSYLYPQNVRPLGVQLSKQSLAVAEDAAVATFKVQVLDPEGLPVEGVPVTAILSWLGTNVRARTDAQGFATLRIPAAFPAVGSILVEPEHTYWSRVADGFQMATAPEVVQFQLTRLLPDAFSLMAKYAPFEAEAGTGVRVGVIDTGVGPHSDLTVAGGACFISKEDRNDFQDNGLGHGTHVAGIIAAKRSGGGVYGLAPACTLLAYRVFPRTGETDMAAELDVAAALEQAISDKCDLVNISLGSLQAMPKLPDLLEDARNAGIVVLAATGNDGRQLLRYPARYSSTLGVGALGRDATFPSSAPLKQNGLARVQDEFVAGFSNHGVGTDFIGVGVAVLSTYPGNRYAMMSGTSMATPFTTGMAARLLSKAPDVLSMERNAARTDAIVGMLSREARRLEWAAVFSGFGVLQ